MKHFFLTLMLFAAACAWGQNADNRTTVLLETDLGNVRIMLYDETPMHRDNFVRLVGEGFYDGVLFHRVINQFMVQTGDSLSRHAAEGALLGEGDYETYRIPAEIRFPELFHKRGAVAAARESDAENPQRESSMCQFYIVTGRRFSSQMLDDVEERIARNSGLTVRFPQEVRQEYLRVGGAPHLDAQYTVFGEVIDGMDIVDQLQQVETDQNDRPLKDVRIIRATVE